MPLYEFHCQCGHTWDQIAGVGAYPIGSLLECPECGDNAERVPSAPLPIVLETYRFDQQKVQKAVNKELAKRSQRPVGPGSVDELRKR